MHLISEERLSELLECEKRFKEVELAAAEAKRAKYVVDWVNSAGVIRNLVHSVRKERRQRVELLSARGASLRQYNRSALQASSYPAFPYGGALAGASLSGLMGQGILR